METETDFFFLIKLAGFTWILLNDFRGDIINKTSFFDIKFDGSDNVNRENLGRGIYVYLI